MAKKSNIEKDLSTEEKILLAADKCFTSKGFAGTRTRDIAEEAGINLALLNYYFRSKEKLFENIMLKKIQQMFSIILPILIDKETALEDKISVAADQYLNLLQKNPGLPLFIINAIQKDNEKMKEVIPADKILKESILLDQISERNNHINPMHILVNFLSLTIFPFLTKPVFDAFGILDQTAFESFVEERRTLIPIWIKTLLDS